MNILLTKTITDAMFAPGTSIPAVDTGETAWASGTYAVGDRCTDGHFWYECIKEVAGSPASTYQPSSSAGGEYWAKDEEAPTNRWGPFDEYLFTKARQTGSVTYVLTPGFVDGIAVHGIEADHLSITATAGAGGPDLIDPISVDLWDQAYGLYEYLFGDLQRGTKYTVKGIPLHPDVHLTITASRNVPTEEAAIGYIGVGQWQRLYAPHTTIPATLSGATAELKSYSYFRQNELTGLYTRKRGRQSIDLSFDAVVDAAEGNRIRNLLSRILDVPVPIEASSLNQFQWLSTVGFVTGTVKASSTAHSEVSFKIKGNP